MASPSNHNLCGDEKEKENTQSVVGISHVYQLLEDPFPSISVPKDRWICQIAAETEAMSQQQLGQLQIAPANSQITTKQHASIAQHSQNLDLSIAGENFLKMNQITTEMEPMRQQQSGQCQPGEPSANSQSRYITKVIAAYLKEKEKLKYYLDILEAQSEGLKSEVDLQTKVQECDAWMLGEEHKMKSNLGTPRPENEWLKREKGNLSMADSKSITFKAQLGFLRSKKECPKQEIVTWNPKFESQLKELDELRKKFDQLKKKYKKKRERIRQLEHDLRTRDAKFEDLNDRYIAVLENFRYASVNTRSEIPLDESAQQRIPRTNSPRNSDCGSGIGIGL